MNFNAKNQFQKKQPSTPLNSTTSALTPEQIEEFFKATEDGSIERLEQLFNEKTNADPNMTQFTESLLMAAIRRQRHEVAEYLIDQLAVNVEYAADLQEFRLRTQMPIRHRTFSCRDLAYEKGMMELVDLIDITSDDVTPAIKRYIQKRLRTRLDIIHEGYLKRFREHNKYLTFRTNDEKENQELSTETNNKSSALMLPSIHRPSKSRIEESISNFDTEQKSFDETGKKTFRFSNYNLRFRLIETPDTDKKRKEQSQSKSTIPTFPIIPLSTSSLSTNNNRHSISESSTRFSMRDSRGSVCDSVRRTAIPQIISTGNKPIITTKTKRLSTKRVNQNNIQHTYIPQQQTALYNQPQHFMPVTLKSTAIGLPSDTHIIRD